MNSFKSSLMVWRDKTTPKLPVLMLLIGGLTGTAALAAEDELEEVVITGS
jgi:hypothetical protein